MLPKSIRFSNEPPVGDGTAHEEPITSDTDPPKTNRGRKHEDRVAQRNPGVPRGIGPAEHLVPSGLVLITDRVGECVEMRELPREKDAGQKPSADTVLAEEHVAPIVMTHSRDLAFGGDPAHHGRDSTHDGTDPSVDHMHALQRRVDKSVQRDVAGGQCSHRRVRPKVEQR